jgi:hypothetical protein
MRRFSHTRHGGVPFEATKEQRQIHCTVLVHDYMTYIGPISFSPRKAKGCLAEGTISNATQHKIVRPW